MQVGAVASVGAAGIDDDDAKDRVLRLRRDHALIQHRVTPCGIGADEDEQVCGLEVFVIARHRIAAERALVPGDARRHAEPRIGVDVGGTDEAFRQLVDDVIIFRQQLAGDVKGDRVRPMFGDRFRETVGDTIERGVPADGLSIDDWRRQPVAEIERLGERRSLRAEATIVGGVIDITA